MDKPSLCRICLVENVRMYVVASRQLQETFEKLTDVPFITEDRPMLACFFCYAKLKQCSQFHRKCMEAENAFTQILNGHYDQKPVRFQYFDGFIKTPINHLDIAEHQSKGTSQESANKMVKLEQDIIIKQEIPEDNFIEQEVFTNQVILEYRHQNLDVSIKQEFVEDEHQEPEFIIELQEITKNVYCKQEQVSSEYSAADSDDDVPLTELKVELEEVAPEEEIKINQLNVEPVARKLYKKKLGNSNSIKQEDIRSSDSEIIESNRGSTSKSVGNILGIPSVIECVNVKISNDRIDTELDSHTRNNGLQAKLYKCKVCPQIFNQKYKLQRHNWTHTGGMKYKCDTCQRCFNQKYKLQRHIWTHTGETPFKCDTCERRFNQKKALVEHVRVHTGQQPFKCDTCQRTFNQKNTLLSHIRVHTGEKPFKCDTCDRSFCQKSTLLNHIRVHTGQKPFKCDTCERSFSQRSHLLTHVRIHTGEKPFKCNTCQRDFGHKSHLLTHLRVHSGQKPYKCDTCERGFRCKSDLQRHVRVHTGDKPFKCVVCERGFSQSSHLLRHIRVHSVSRGAQGEVTPTYET